MVRVDRRARHTHRRFRLAACGFMERKRVDKPHLPKRELDSIDSQRHVKLGNSSLTSLRHIQKAQLELVEHNIKQGQTWLSRRPNAYITETRSYFALAILILPIIFQYSISAPAISLAFKASSSGKAASRYSYVSKSMICTPVGLTANT